jgi:hypothetical protein
MSFELSRPKFLGEPNIQEARLLGDCFTSLRHRIACHPVELLLQVILSRIPLVASASDTAVHPTLVNPVTQSAGSHPTVFWRSSTQPAQEMMESCGICFRIRPLPRLEQLPSRNREWEYIVDLEKPNEYSGLETLNRLPPKVEASHLSPSARSFDRWIRNSARKSGTTAYNFNATTYCI